MDMLTYFHESNKDLKITQDEVNWFKFEFNTLGGLYKLTHPYKQQMGYDSDIDYEGDCVLCSSHSMSNKACVSSRKEGVLSVCDDCFTKYNFTVYNL